MKPNEHILEEVYQPITKYTFAEQVFFPEEDSLIDLIDDFEFGIITGN